MIKVCEYVSFGHPDKIADQISDALLDEYLKQDKNSRCGIETMVKDNVVVIGGEVHSNAIVNHEEVIKNVYETIKFPPNHNLTSDNLKIINLIGQQSQEIHNGVDKETEIGAGDQGLMYGYACDETPTYMPLGSYLSKKICDDIASLNEMEIGPDVKTQVIIDYDENGKSKVLSILVSAMHQCSIELMRDIVSTRIKNNLVGIDEKIFVEQHIDEVKLDINPCGSWNIGGPISDCGVTGRKLVVDNYGSYCEIGGGAYCVDGDTEYIGEDLKWHKISEYNGGKVGQWEDGVLSFVQPYHYHIHDNEKMYHIHTPLHIDMVLSEHHDVVIETSKGNIIKKMVKDIIEDNHIINGNNGNIPMYFNYFPTNSGIHLSDDEIRLQIAFCADGSITSKNKGRVRVKKDYKKESLEYLLNSTNTEYSISEYEYEEGFKTYRFTPPIISKSLYECFKNCNRHQFEVIADEVVKWDGDNDKLFRTTIKEDADFIQFVFMSVYGTISTILTDDRVGQIKHNNTYDKDYFIKTKSYEIRHLESRHTNLKYGITNNRTQVDEFVPTDGKMYCFTVPSSILVLRRNDLVFVTGNCGKDMTKVDRSAAYMARYIAKNIVANGLAKTAKVSLSYMIGVAKPCSFDIILDDNTNKDKIIEWVLNNVDLTPSGIINRFNGTEPQYFNTARYGHYGNNSMPCEKIDLKIDI